MPSEQPPPSSRLARTGFDQEALPEQSGSALRALLGLPSHETGSRPAASLTQPSTGVRYAQSFLPAPEETEETAWELEEENAEESARELRQNEPPGETIGTTTPRTVDHLPDMGARTQTGPTRGLSPAQPDTAPERTTLTIPGISTSRQDFRAVSHPQDVSATITTGAPQKESPEPVQQNSLPSARARTPRPALPDLELLTRLERLVADAETNQKSAAQPTRETDWATWRQGAATDGPAAGHLSSSLPSSPFAQASVSGVQRATQDLATQLEQLRRTVRALAARMSSQEARMHDNRQPQQRERTAPQPAQRVIIMKQPAPPPTTPRAFWDRSHLSRLRLRTLR